MSETIKSYRIRTNVGEDNYVSVNLEQDYDAFDILSLTINTNDMYRLHNSNYGVIVGRVLANNGFGIPNAKISIFIEADETQREELAAIYSYTTTASVNKDGVRYNLLPDNEVGDCHQVVGTFPNKRYVLDNEDIIEVFEKYFKYTTRTNNSGDYIICGVPKGLQTLHMDLDLSDCGILSQRPRDFVYKGYTIEQFENPNMFKTATTLSSLSQLFTQDQNVNVQPFWGNDSLGETIGITRADINVDFKFEPTCVFLGSVVSDNSSNGITKKCMGTPHMGDMDELTTGEGTIEMIRKTYGGKVESFQIKGTELIDGNGIWCYQIPMNLDYMTTDEYGNMVPTDNPDKGIPTRARVRFRVSLHDHEQNVDNFFRPKVLVPHNPSDNKYDYEFGTNTDEGSFRDLFWNNVYSVKSYIPRFQKRKVRGWKDNRFTGIKGCQYYGKNNPMPYNNIRIKLPFMFIIMCILIKAFIKLTGLLNRAIAFLGRGLAGLGLIGFKEEEAGKLVKWFVTWLNDVLFRDGLWQLFKKARDFSLVVIEDGLCPDLDNWYFAPVAHAETLDFRLGDDVKHVRAEEDEFATPYNIMKQTLRNITTADDPKSIDDKNEDPNDGGTCLTVSTDYLIACIEMNLAQEYRVINFDFYNDWVNGTIYIPRFMRYVKKKVTFLGMTLAKEKVKGCMDDTKIFSKSRRYTQQCALKYTAKTVDGRTMYSQLENSQLTLNNNINIIKNNNLHKRSGFGQVTIFGSKGGVVHEQNTMYNQHVYYLKPCEWNNNGKVDSAKINLFATDLILLGSLNDCDENGVPQAFLHLKGSTYIMPTNIALTNMEENGPLYTVSGFTLCSEESTTTENNVGNSGRTLTIVDPNSTEKPLGEELSIFSRTGNINDDVEYNDPSDTIALTEAAGIAWNFSGPQQGNIDEKKMYYPGGHFLGLSCINSQTNVKSCLNLERICEAGVTMSQRREEIAINDNGTTKNVYIVPTGFVSKDEIVDEDFRAMFATMNKKRLVATKINPDTGYKMYDFASITPINFSGEFRLAGVGTPYNSDIKVNDENLTSFGIHRGNTRDDYDVDEKDNTRTRTLESSSLEYYAFRMGLEYSEMAPNSTNHFKRFADARNSNYVLLPQYDNSFYFYFGLHDGATALDEFNKQFYSDCGVKTILKSDPEIKISVGDYNACEQISIVNFYVYNMLPPYNVKIGNDIREEKSSVFERELTKGKYTVTVTDFDNKEVSANFTVGADFCTYDMVKYEFNREPKLNADMVDWSAMGGKNIFNGGYIQWSNVSVKGIDNSNGGMIWITISHPGASPETCRVDSGGNAIYYTKFVNDSMRWNINYSCGSGIKTIQMGMFTFSERPGGRLQIGVVKPIEFNKIYSLLSASDPHNWFELHTEKFDGSNDQDTNYPDNATWAWNVRKSVVRPYEDGVFSFDTNISPSVGEKISWGNPQNGSDIDDDDLFSSLSYNEIPNGMMVDDEYTYFGTQGGNRDKFYGLSYSGSVVSETLIGKIASGEYEATSDGNGIIKKYELIDSSAVPGRGGCLFKSLQDESLIPGVFSAASSTKQIILWGDPSLLSGRTSVGLVYATHEHPIITLPFKVDARYLLRYSASGVTNPSIVKVVPDVVVENGIRFNNHYCGASYIDWRFTGTTDANILYCNQSNVEPSVVVYSGKGTTSSSVKYINGDDGLSYSIIEGYPMYYRGSTVFAFRAGTGAKLSNANEYAEHMEKRSLNIKWRIYDPLILLQYDDTHFAITGRTDGDADIKYYICDGGSNSSVTLYDETDTSEYISYIQMFLSGATSGGNYVGTVIPVRFKISEGEYRATFTMPNGDAQQIRFDAPHDPSTTAITAYDVYCPVFIEKAATSGIPLAMVRCVTGTVSTSYSTRRWVNSVARHARGNVLADLPIGRQPMPMAVKNCYGDYGMSSGSVYWVSESPLIIPNMPYGPPVIVSDNTIDPSQFTFSSESTTGYPITIDFRLSSDSENRYRIESSDEWLRFGNNGNVYDNVISASSKTEIINLVLGENTEESDRFATITIKWGESLERSYAINVKQLHS